MSNIEQLNYYPYLLFKNFFLKKYLVFIMILQTKFIIIFFILFVFL